MLPAALAAVNWALLLKDAPKLVNSARQLYETFGKRDRGTPPATGSVSVSDLSTGVQELRSRLEEVGAGQETQAAVVSRMAVQEEALSRGLQAVAARLTVLLWVSGGALALAAVAVVLSIVR